ncbi:hypothetical protein [Halosimplex amylolyticum]|uniref:hypothetical protein n=1 Tax=Halosimplex amylolyticum TaxID=3396616 RepID=UPI003F55E7F1
MVNRFPSKVSPAQKMVVIVGIIVLLLIGGVAISTGVFDGRVESKSVQTSTKTATQVDIPTSARTSIPTPVITQTEMPIPTQTVTSTPTKIQTPTPTRTPRATATPSPYANERYSEFVATVYGETEVDADVPVRIRGWTVLVGKELVMVMNLTAHSEDDIRRAKEVNTLVSSGYAQAVAHYDNGKIDGEIPNKLRIAEVNNTGSPPQTLYVNTSLVRNYYTGQLTAMEFTDRYWSTKTNMSEGHIEYVENIDRSAGNSTLYNSSE